MFIRRPHRVSSNRRVLLELGQTIEAQEMINSILEMNPKDGNAPSFDILVKCIGSILKGLLFEIVSETDPERASRLLLESVSEFHLGYQITTPHSRFKLQFEA